MTRPTGARNGRWNRERIRSSHGYLMERVGVGHPLADSRGYAYSHCLVWAAAGRALPTKTQELHHVDGNRENNRLSNLRLMERADHARLHAMTRLRQPNGTFAKERAA